MLQVGILWVGVIGPTNLQGLSEDLGGVSRERILEWANFVGRILAELGCGLVTNPGEGVLAEVAKAYKKNGGMRWVMVIPTEPIPWPNYHALPYAGRADIDLFVPDWNEANHVAVKLVQLCICLGMSGGTDGEISKAIYDARFGLGKLVKLLAPRELLEGSRLPLHVERDLRGKLTYLEEMSEQQLLQIITELKMGLSS